ncbi:hypothetical protein N9165_02695 [Akkermansiaceae bacterium]|nr:hypothetical protein [Akkermansiaceae bacterium]MDB4508411.1 hypothetical protein [Akkermansiaceae bacterium]
MFKGRFWPPVLISGIIVLILNFAVTPEFPQYRFMPLLSLWVVVFIAARFIFRKEASDLPVLGVSALLWIYFCLPLLWTVLPRRHSRVDPAPYLGEVSLVAGLGILAFITGYYFLLGRVKVKPLFSRRIVFKGEAARSLAFLLLSIGLGYRFIELQFPSMLKSTGQIFVVFDYCILLGSGVSLRVYLRRKMTNGLLWFTIFVFTLDTLCQVYSTLLARTAYAAIGMILVYMLETRKLPRGLLIVFAIVLLPLYANRKIHRSEAVERWGSGHHSNLFESVSGGIVYATDSYGELGAEKVSVSTQQEDILHKEGVLRFENVTFMAQCTSLLNDGKKLKWGSTFWYTPLAPIPRVILPWKPRNTHCSLLANEYKVRNPQSRCAINFPWLAEWYVNFGILGAVIGSALFGVFFAYIFAKTDFGRGDLNILVFLHLLWWLVKVESDIPMVIGGMLQTIIIWVVIRYLTRNKLREFAQRGLIHYKKRRTRRLVGPSQTGKVVDAYHSQSKNVVGHTTADQP